MTASTDIFCDLTDDEPKNGRGERCCLCLESAESRAHLLTDFPATVHLVANFIDTIKTISPYKQDELLALAPQLRWLWILGGGSIPLEESKRTQRITHPKSIFTPGKSAQKGFDRKNNISASDAYYEFKEIEYTLDSDCILAYTDGSYHDGISGSGAAIYHKKAKIREISSPNGKTSIAYAELFAILSVLRWIKGTKSIYKGSDVHFFTDSSSQRRHYAIQPSLTNTSFCCKR